ncbi:MAG: fluoride efflux transporter CrcB [Nakamurella sp.]
MLGYALVAVGAAVGAPLRYLTDRMVQIRHTSTFPWGTFTVNVVGSMILGVLAGLYLVGSSGSEVNLLVGTGLCGALTTYSTLSYETVRLVEQRARFLAAANLLGTVVAGLGAVVVGFTIGQAV